MTTEVVAKPKTAPKAAAKKSNKRLDSNEIAENDVFSEVSHYTFKKANGNDLTFIHHESKEEVTLNKDYVENFLWTANQWDGKKVVEVGKIDKLWTDKRIEEWKATHKDAPETKDIPKVGDVMTPGIRTLWDNIHSAHVFQVCFKKQDTPFSAKKLAELRDAQIKTALESIEKAQKNKTGIAKAATEELKKIQENPVLPYEEGKMRTLCGYKIQFSSIDGRYQCMDMEKNEQRPVNINTIEWLVFNGVKYIVK